MLEKENLCSGCETNCCDDFRLNWSGQEIEQLINEYPFLRVKETGVALIGKYEKTYRVMECDRLQEDGSCEGYPNNRPVFCEKAGVESRPAKNCKLNDSLKAE